VLICLLLSSLMAGPPLVLGDDGASAGMVLLTWQAVERPVAAPAGEASGLLSDEPTTNPSEMTQPTESPRLIRELARQALLIAARDGLGLSTRDQVLGEAIPAEQPWLGQTLDLRWKIDGKIHIAVTRRPDGTPVFEGDVFPGGPQAPLSALSERMEKLSRGRFVEALREAGWTGQANRVVPDAPVDPQIEEWIGKLNELSQYAAVRALHAAIRESGESPARLGALARAYAHLGELTRYQWTAAHDAFAARALLYAQRMRVATPDSSDGLWTRAYVRALLGLHGAALGDVELARRAGGAEPPWARLIEPLCYYRTGELRDIAASDPTLAPMASYMSFLTLENSGAQAATMEAVQGALEVNPECLRLLDVACDRTGPGMLNWLSEHAPSVYSVLLGQRLATMPAMPDAIQTMIRERRRAGGNPAGRKIVWTALADLAASGEDRNEPSLGVLADLIEQTTFVQTWRRAHLIRHQWGVDASDYVSEVWPLVQDHPFGGLIKSFGLDPAGETEQQTRILQEMVDTRFDDVELDFPSELMVADDLSRHGITRGRQGRDLWREPILYADLVAPDREAALRMAQDNQWPDDLQSFYAQLLEGASPNAPLVLAVRLRTAWNEQDAVAIEAEHGSYPAVAMALATQYAKQDKLDDAARCLVRYIEASPDKTGYLMLADIHERRGDMIAWRSTLDDFLNQPDYGLQHASVRVKVASRLMDRGEYRQALPYAEAAADTGASWARACAQRAYEQLGDFESAEEMARANANHYDMDGGDWLLFCIKTGLGDRAGAQAAADEFLSRYGDDQSESIQWQVGVLTAAQGRHREAIKHFAQAYEISPHYWYLLFMASEAQQLGDTAARGEALARIPVPDAVQAGEGRPVYEELAAALRTALAGNTDLEPEFVDGLLKDADPRGRLYVHYFAARHARLRGNTARATELLLPLLDYDDVSASAVVLGWRDLREMGTDPVELIKKRATTRRSD
jgi:tetratricopeptide (TPR) repeat protein